MRHVCNEDLHAIKTCTYINSADDDTPDHPTSRCERCIFYWLVEYYAKIRNCL